MSESRLVARMAAHTTTIFGEMSALALRTGSVNLGQGFPDTDGPELLKLSAVRAIESGAGNQYPPAHGYAVLREAISEHQRMFYGLEVNPDTDVVVTTGASEALGAAVMALVEPGEEVIVLEPWFDLYAAVISLAGAAKVSVPMVPDASGSFRPDPGAIRAAITPRTRMLLINSPHNPTGTVFTRAELDAIARVAIEHDLIVLSDEAYEHLWFDGHPHLPIATLPGMAERTVSIGSAGKTFSFTGWKVGWATGPSDLIAAVRVVRQHLSYVSGGPFQLAVADGLREFGPLHWDRFRHELQGKRDRLSKGLAALGMKVAPSQGTYFVVTDVRPLGFEDDLTFCRELPGRCGVVAIPMSVFYDEPALGKGWVRWAFCKRDEVLDEALERLWELGGLG